MITGASMGIGEAFADALVARGYDVALVARSAPALEAIAQRLRTRGARAEVIVADLTVAGEVESVSAQAEARFGRIDLLVNNAGLGAHGKFEAIDAAATLAQLRLNIEALVMLTHRLAPGMLARGSGGIINVASTAAFQPVPTMAVYGATKAFVLSFSEALAEEYRLRGVRVLALCPGATATNFFAVAGESASLGPRRSVEGVVQTALRAYDRRQTYVIDGLMNKILAFSPRLTPRPLIARVAGMLMRVPA